MVDESGTHGGSHCFVLGALAIHESDTTRLQKKLDQVVIEYLERAPVNLEEYELHASELRNAKKPRANQSQQKVSVWAHVPRADRLALLDAAYKVIVNFQPLNPATPPCLFGVVIDAKFRSNESQVTREQFAYEVLLNKFDVMLKPFRSSTNPQHGLVIHDRRIVAERDIQGWTAEWRLAAGRVGQLRNLADVPVFADSRASRLLQVADLVSYALFRAYMPETPDGRYFDVIWDKFNRVGETVHGCVHYTPSFGAGICECLPCQSRLPTATPPLFSRP